MTDGPLQTPEQHRLRADLAYLDAEIARLEATADLLQVRAAADRAARANDLDLAARLQYEEIPKFEAIVGRYAASQAVSDWARSHTGMTSAEIDEAAAAHQRGEADEARARRQALLGEGHELGR